MTGAVEAQRRAARPDASSWVSANAGSGKTRVLTDRVARLLLAGNEPQRILCLTYTKAAAAEMQNRLFETLGHWSMLDDDPLRAALLGLGEPADDLPPARLDQARTLFARALETPGGLRIQTIHAFCEALLRRFPLEAGIAPQFSVLDDRQANALRAEVLDELAEREPEIFGALARFFNQADADPFLQEIARHRAAFAAPFDPEALARTLSADPALTAEALLATTLYADDARRLHDLLPQLVASGGNDAKAVEGLTRALEPGDPDTRLALLEKPFIYGPTAKNNAFGPKVGAFPTKRVRDKGDFAWLDALMERVAAARPHRLALASFRRAEAINRFGRAWLGAWHAAKAARGYLDFDDMIDRTQALLARRETAAFVLWRLDGGIDHILVDEAQDTSPAQWQVIEAISDEFFAGAGAREIARTIFVVGDEKQSIYSFQGAEPAEFAAQRRRYRELLDSLGAELQRCDLLYSFRSAAPILGLVDAVFAGAAGEGLTGAIEHHAFFADLPGRVELWPFLPKPEKPDEGLWHEPMAAPAAEDPVELLATRIAGTVAGWLADGLTLPGGTPVRAGDVMILVQTRGAIFDAVIRALKRAGVPVAGADLLRIGGELAVKDLLAALRWIATPADTLSLAAFLRSPLGGVSERELFGLAHGRKLERALFEAPPGAFAGARALLDDLKDQADFLRPFELLSRMLTRHGGRARLVARLGVEAEDGIDALLDQALAYERIEAPTLTGFLDWFDRDAVTVKRRSDEGTDQVRVMTVHGAKGLEAPIVILPDTATRNDSRNPPQIVRLEGGQPAWRIGLDAYPPALDDAEQQRRALVRAESRRLLYVALTRARSWLIVCGAGPTSNGAGGESWHDLVAEAMRRSGAAAVPGPDGPVLSHDKDWTPTSTAAIAEAAAAPPAALPAWMEGPPPRAPEPIRLVAPSLFGGTLALAGEPLGERPEDARARGTAIHLLLEHLHDVAPAERAAHAAALLPDEPERGALLAEVEHLLAAADLAPVFAPDALAEVAITAPIPGQSGARLLGRIDRLLVSDTAVTAIDFKTNRVVPGTAAEMPEGILRQLGAYSTGLRAIWPGREIRLAVLWTRAARLMPVDPAEAEAAFARAGT